MGALLAPHPDCVTCGTGMALSSKHLAFVMDPIEAVSIDEDATFVMTLNRMIPEVDRPPLVNQYARFTLPDEPIPRWGTAP